MAIAKIVTEQIKIPNQDLAIDAYLAQPQDSGSYPAMIVIQEIFGVNDHIKDVTERIAQQGYIAVAPAIYQRQAPGFAAGYTPEDVTLGRQHKEQTKAKELLSDIQATIDYLYQLPSVKTTGVGTVGFCFGGHVVYLAATLNDVRATASFYGAQIVNWCPGEDEPTIKRTKDIDGTIYAFFGTADSLIPNEQVDQIATELATQQIEHRVFRYEGADHGFFCDRRQSYNPDAAKDAWQKMLDLFSQKL
ncbi:putative carboxymethylenebutenolidase [Hyella patelloides LEGE 07179]|uniref:Putative carboxymethylenebutenolidase n=1 Tax=Hyella patelloides LEGE 07179 TaxID=945734 RepID=A0A563VN56_9CYAN|nr:dienelactone hydrolase family protein [Hyella patelloides]VEP12869.1 putative carboxymethylenebutenolidase [Hyella patelloides LEGE 07179]